MLIILIPIITFTIMMKIMTDKRNKIVILNIVCKLNYVSCFICDYIFKTFPFLVMFLSTGFLLVFGATERRGAESRGSEGGGDGGAGS